MMSTERGGSMRIQELERMVDADRATIRFYEKEGLIRPNRSENGYRDYTQENACELKKIRLLRQLGMSIQTIRQLQQGSTDFREALEAQIRELSAQIDLNRRSQFVCRALRDDSARYETMDADHYLDLLHNIRIDERSEGTDFQEAVPREIHPWRRWLARILDYGLLVMAIDFLIIVVLRVRPVPGDFMNAVIAVLAGAAFVPIEACFISRWGTTPGKAAMGIRLESVNGGNLPFIEAIRRAWSVYQEGMFFNITFIKDCLNLYRYFQLTGRSFRFARKEDIPDPQDMLWDDETEIIYTPLSWRRGAVLGAMVLLLIAGNLFIGIDSVKPVYRGNQLTIAEFADNYNHTVGILNKNADIYDMLQEDGTKYPVPQNTVIVDFTGSGEWEPEEFEYVTENGILRSITIHRSWEDIMFVKPLDSEIVYVVFSVVLGHENGSLAALMEISEQMDEKAGLDKGEIVCQDLIRIQWEIHAENCVQSNGTYYGADNGDLSRLEYTVTVTIL